MSVVTSASGSTSAELLSALEREAHLWLTRFEEIRSPDLLRAYRELFHSHADQQWSQTHVPCHFTANARPDAIVIGGVDGLLDLVRKHGRKMLPMI